MSGSLNAIITIVLLGLLFQPISNRKAPQRPTDCNISAWVNDGPCVLCEQTQTRTVTQATNGGKACPENTVSQQIIPCTACQPCADLKTCTDSLEFSLCIRIKYADYAVSQQFYKIQIPVIFGTLLNLDYAQIITEDFYPPTDSNTTLILVKIILSPSQKQTILSIFPTIFTVPPTSQISVITYNPMTPGSFGFDFTSVANDTINFIGQSVIKCALYSLAGYSAPSSHIMYTICNNLNVPFQDISWIGK
jgi:hypothetical protein